MDIFEKSHLENININLNTKYNYENYSNTKINCINNIEKYKNH